jgi:AraC family transcriptional regulator of adaptative response/methylated-DNA-[protein]-cysteine methyltransferase
MGAAIASYRTETARWSAVQRRSPRADGVFFYAVATTGVYCRPSCASRPARRENVIFYKTRKEAERAGYRPCLRCRPDLAPQSEREAALIADACLYLAAEGHQSAPSLAELASRVSLSPYHFHRLFRRVAGVTPKAYASAIRQAKLVGKLQKSASVTEAIYDAGFPSSSRFYEASAATLGMKPSVYRRGGEGESIWHVVRKCSLGRVLVAGTAHGVCAILLGDDPAALAAGLRARFPKANLSDSNSDSSVTFDRWVEQAVRLVDDPLRSAARALPLDVRGTAFQCRVWKTLQAIRPGSTLSYAEVAAAIGKPRAVRAVANACAANRLAVAIPCHRVIAADGKPGGYRWGTDRKKRLLEREQPAKSR